MKASDLVPEWFCADPLLPTPISETHEFLSNGIKEGTLRHTSRKIVNFRSYKRKENSRKTVEGAISPVKKISIQEHVTQYMMDYYKQAPRVCSVRQENFVDPLFNRIPKNELVISKESEHKFMDDFLILPHPDRVRIDFMRQMRNVSYFDVLNRQLP